MSQPDLQPSDADQPMHAPLDALDVNYAQALIELAEEGNQLDEIVDEVQQLAELARGELDFRRLLDARSISEDQRRQAINRVLDGRISELLLRFLMVLNERGRLGRLLSIAHALDRLMMQRRGEIEAYAYVAHPLSDQQQEQLADRLGQVLGKTVRLRQREQPELIGGLRLRIGDRMIDASVRYQLRAIRQRMIESGHAQAHQSLKDAPAPWA